MTRRKKKKTTQATNKWTHSTVVTKEAKRRSYSPRMLTKMTRGARVKVEANLKTKMRRKAQKKLDQPQRG
jgi:predicted homoserine dehydrogenase-like protein